jgi:hypothetical protein
MDLRLCVHRLSAPLPVDLPRKLERSKMTTHKRWERVSYSCPVFLITSRTFLSCANLTPTMASEAAVTLIAYDTVFPRLHVLFSGVKGLQDAF